MKFNKRTIKYEQEIVESFHSGISLLKLCKKLNFHEKTIKNVWFKHFTPHQIKNRIITRDYQHRFMENYNPEIVEECLSYFTQNISINDVGKLLNVSPATVVNVWKRHFGEEKYRERKANLKPKSSQACFVGSKNEIYCYNLLKTKHKAKHHDYSIIDNLEIDITLPTHKIAINWDGPFHFLPIRGQECLENIQRKDRIKQESLHKLNWKHIKIIDLGSFNKLFVEEVVNRINYFIVHQGWNNIEIHRDKHLSFIKLTKIN